VSQHSPDSGIPQYEQPYLVLWLANLCITINVGPRGYTCSTSTLYQCFFLMACKYYHNTTHLLIPDSRIEAAQIQR